MRLWRLRSVGLILAAALATAACGGSTPPPAAPSSAPASNAPTSNAPASSAPAAEKPATTAPAASTPNKPLRHVVFRLAFYMAGYDAPFVLAKEKGYYAQAGLDVDIQEGRGSATTAQTVANGSDTYGFADAGTAAEVASKGAPVVVIAGLLQKTPLGFIYHADHPVSKPADLKGRTYVADAGSAGFKLLPAVLGKYGLTLKDVKENFVSPQAQAATFKANPSFVVVGNNNSTYITLLQVVPDAGYTSLADFGVNPYGLALITSRDEIKNHPDDVRGFVQASVRGWEDALKDPKAAVDVTLKAYPGQKEAVLAKGLEVSFDLLHNPDTKDKPLGWMTEEGWKNTVDLLHTYGGLKNVQPLDTYYTNEFLSQ